MLKRFVLNALSSFVGAWLAIGVCLLGLVLLGIGLLGSFFNKNFEKLIDHSILKISLSGSISETESMPQFDIATLMSGRLEKGQSLQTLCEAIREAKTNGKIDAIYISCEGVSAAPATLDALRNELLNFKESGKRIYAYGDQLSLGDYYVATAADEVYLNPAGTLNLQGLNGTTLYYKDLLDKLGIGIQVCRVGSFKSAVEPYISNEMSEPARLQLDTLYNGMWSYMLSDISTQRKVSVEAIDSLVNNFLFLEKAEVPKKYKLVSDCLYKRQVMDIMASYVGKDSQDLNFVSPKTVVDNIKMPSRSDNNQIAVLYAVGEIAEYEGAGINCNSLVPEIVNLAKDDNVKGLVLRVNSPGGSVFGSEQIGEALDYFKSTGKPFAVSMGDYAASGGYWISASADRIFADPLTITGSIGIFGVVPNIQNLVEKIGVHPQTVSTNPGVRFPAIFYPMSDEQQEALQKSLDRGYEDFVTRVAKGRNKSVEYIKGIAQGRVWSAIKAKELGLVDELGGLQQAVKWVAGNAGIGEPNVVYYPEMEPSFMDFLDLNAASMPSELKSVLAGMKKNTLEDSLLIFGKWILLQNPVQARIPVFLISL